MREVFKNNIVLTIKGFCMGAADVIPGVSGGTMAFILGIYSRLINAIKSFDLPWLKSIFKLDIKNIFGRPHFVFLIPLGIGIFCALMFFTRVVSLPTLINTHPEPVYALFFGLIAGSILVLLTHLQAFGFKNAVSLLGGLLVGAIVFNMVPVQTPETSWFIFFCGALAICAMMLPGISGSFILLILKKYAYIFSAIGNFQFSVLIPFALGAATGLILFSRVLSYLLKVFHQATILIITGMLLASLWVIWPFQQRDYEILHGKKYLIHSTPYLPESMSAELLLPAGLAILGLFMVLGINKLAKDKVLIGG